MAFSVQQRNRGLAPTVLLSLLVHGSIFGYIVYAQSLTPKIQPFESVPVELVRLGKPKDPKLLPRLAPKASPKASPDPEPTAQKLPTKSDDDAVALETAKKKKKKKSTAQNQKLSNRAEKLLSGASLDRALEKLDEVEGQEDGVVGGTSTDPSKAAKGYAAQLSQTLRQSYALPETIPASQRRFLRAEVLLRIDAQGNIQRYSFVQRHPNTAFMTALEALLTRLKLPAPPAEIRSQVQDPGITVIFSP